MSAASVSQLRDAELVEFVRRIEHRAELADAPLSSELRSGRPVPTHPAGEVLGSFRVQTGGEPHGAILQELASVDQQRRGGRHHLGAAVLVGFGLDPVAQHGEVVRVAQPVRQRVELVRHRAQHRRGEVPEESCVVPRVLRMFPQLVVVARCG